tara:strand:- start:285 stop:707 length:423 start_codon:yes stop_codon:yes gene_type:complete
MATTTAAITLSSDLLSDSISVSTSTTCMKAGTTGDGLDEMRMGFTKVPTGTSFDLIDATAAHVDKANKVYICNNSTDETYYIIVTIDARVIGRLYANDWMFIPWNADDATHDLEVQAYGGTNDVMFMVFHEGETLTTSAD